MNFAKVTKKTIDLTKSFFFPDELEVDPDSFMEEQIAALSDKRSISRLLFYRSYVENGNLCYYIQADGRIGIIFKITPPPYLTTSTEKDVISLINSIVMDDSVVHINAFASQDIHGTIDSFENIRDNVHPNIKNPEVLNEYTQDLKEKMLSYTDSSISGKESDLRVRNFIHTVSILFPYDTDEFIINQQYNQMMGMFKSYGIKPFKPNEFVPFIKEILNPSLGIYPKSNDTITTINKQMTRDTHIKLNKKTKLLEFPNNWKARVLTTDKYPREIDIFTFQNVFFSSMGDDFQINLPNPFLLTLTIKFPNRKKEKKKVLSKARWNLGQLSGMPHMVYKKRPQLKERRDENEEVIHYLEDLGQEPLEAFMSLVLFEKDEDKLDQYTALIKKSFEGVRGQWILKEENFPQIAYQTFLMSLPLQYSGIIHQNIDKFDKNFTANNAQMSPLIGDFKGNGIPNHLYIGRTGQLISLDIFESDNYNIVVIGPMGSGKSVWTNDFLAKALSAGWQVRMVDFGRSYEKFSESVGGQFVDFSENVCMNFFTEIQTKIEIIDGKKTEVIIDEEIELLVPIVGFMASLNLQDIYKDLNASADDKMSMTVISVLLADAMQKAFRVKGRQAGMREVREALVDFKNLAIENKEEIISDKLIQICKTLEPYSLERGSSFKLFNGASNVSFENHYFVLELNDISTSPIMPVVAMLFLQRTAREAFVGYMKDKSTRRIVGVDEAWKVLDNPLFAKFLEDFARRIRKYFGIPMIITQTVDEFFQNPQAEVIYKTADWKIYLPHSKDTIDQSLASGKISLNDFDISLFKSLKSRYPHYSEFFVKHKNFEFVCLLKLTPYGYWLSTSAPKDRLKTDVVMKKYNLNLQDSIRFLAKEMEGYSEDEIFFYLSNRKNKNLDINWDKFFKKIIQKKAIRIRKEPIIDIKNKNILFDENLPTLVDGEIEYYPKDFIYKAKELDYFFNIKTIFVENIFSEKNNSENLNSLNISIDGIRNKKFHNFISNILANIKEDFYLEIILDTNEEKTQEMLTFAKEIRNYNNHVKIVFDNMKFSNINLSSLIEFKPEYIKINIEELRLNKNKKEFIEMVRVLGKYFNIRTIITFVETIDDLNLVKESNFNFAQGFYFKENNVS